MDKSRMYVFVAGNNLAVATGHNSYVSGVTMCVRNLLWNADDLDHVTEPRSALTSIGWKRGGAVAL